ncbi:S1C family serine protease [Streptomyces harbinensis]|uniref:S1C family serine protease n=1 Tax=Streptomyces harbinensis TaxID=1176198 RepID=UPI00371B8352
MTPTIPGPSGFPSRLLTALALGTLCALPACTSAERSAPAADIAPRADAGALEDAYQQVVSDVLPSVVQITTADGLGSGIIYDNDGHIVTNAHVVGEQKTFEVLLADQQQPLPATVVATYPPQDLAVVVLDTPPDRLRPASFGDSGRVEVGQIVLAMGAPLGLSSSVTQGIVSAVGRSVSEGEGGTTLGDMVQTSAAINPGNSGGALVNLQGEVIGIPTLAARDPQLGGGQAPGIGFAIPARTVTDLADQMIENGEVTRSGRAALGVSVRTILGDGFQPIGAAVVDLTENGPAAKAGLRAGDVVVWLGDEPVTDVGSLSEALAGLQPGDKVKVGYLRNGDRHDTEVTLGEV